MCSCNTGYKDIQSHDCFLVMSPALEVAITQLSCPSGYFLDFNLACEKCDANCTQCAVAATDCTDCDASRHFVLENSTCVCKQGYTDAYDKCTEYYPPSAIDGALTTATLATLGAVGVSALPILMLSSPSSMMQFIDIIQLLSYILYVQVDYPQRVIDFFNFFGGIFNLQFIPSFIGPTRYTMRSPLGFWNQGVDGLFIRNAEQYFIFGVPLACFYLLIRYLSSVVPVAENQNILINLLARGIARTRRMFEFTGIIFAMEASYMDFTIYSMVQVQDSAVRYSAQAVSYMLAYCSMLFVSYLLYAMFSVAQQALAIKHAGKDVAHAFHDKYGVLFELF